MNLHTLCPLLYSGTALPCAVAFFLVLGLPASHSVAAESEFRGAGSSAAAPIYKVWAREYEKKTGVVLNYEPIGSSAGIKKITARTTDFGASDVAPNDTELAAQGLVLVPVAITGIAPVVNIPKIADGQLRLTGEVLARIYLGEVKQWNAPDIARLNPGTAMPDLPIKVVVRSDGSGTTYNFADYLSKVSPAWKTLHGVKTSLKWPESFMAAKGSEGVVKAVKETPGAIGYVDFGYIKDNKLAATQILNMHGEYVRPGPNAFRVALGNSQWTKADNFTTTLTQSPGGGAWPITMATFVLFPRTTQSSDVTQRALQFFVWAFVNGDALVGESNFVRLPDRVQAAAFKAIASVRDKTGASVGLAAIAGLN